MAYLEYRERLPVWSSPGIPFPPAKFSGEADQGQTYQSFCRNRVPNYIIHFATLNEFQSQQI